MRIANYPHDGFYAFRSKANPNEVPFVVFLEDGLKIEDYYDEITEAEYAAIVAEQKKAARKMMSRM